MKAEPACLRENISSNFQQQKFTRHLMIRKMYYSTFCEFLIKTDKHLFSPLFRRRIIFEFIIPLPESQGYLVLCLWCTTGFCWNFYLKQRKKSDKKRRRNTYSNSKFSYMPNYVYSVEVEKVILNFVLWTKKIWIIFFNKKCIWSAFLLEL